MANISQWVSLEPMLTLDWTLESVGSLGSPFHHPAQRPTKPFSNHTAGACFGAFILWVWHWLGGPVTQREAANRARVLK